MAPVRPPPLALSDLLSILPDAVVMVDEHGVIMYANSSVLELLGYAANDLVGQPLSVLMPPAVRDRHQQLVVHFRHKGAPKMMGSRPVLHAVHRTGRLVPVSISLCNLPSEDGAVVSVAVIHDVSLLNTHLDRATALAQTDALTGLGNRLMLSRQIHACLESARPFSLLRMDLTGFKGLNDRLGHAAGDEALRVIGQRLLTQIRETDVAVRLGGDEFVLLMDGLNSPARLRELAVATARSLAQPMRLAGVARTLGVNIGGARFPGHGSTEQDVLAAADAAMHAAKQAGEPYCLAPMAVR
jgi:diguanylate cyclase (GGDEF)-like protein/PAS domain S-box-containing protein